VLKKSFLFVQVLKLKHKLSSHFLNVLAAALAPCSRSRWLHGFVMMHAMGKINFGASSTTPAAKPTIVEQPPKWSAGCCRRTCLCKSTLRSFRHLCPYLQNHTFEHLIDTWQFAITLSTLVPCHATCAITHVTLTDPRSACSPPVVLRPYNRGTFLLEEIPQSGPSTFIWRNRVFEFPEALAPKKLAKPTFWTE
jgi:hypothetical protein